MAANLWSSSEIEDKVFLVTGGAAGVGAALVRALLQENARFVAFLDIKEHEGLALEAELWAKFGALAAKFIKCDISNEVELADAFNQVYAKYRRLDGLINNAAVLNTDQRAFKKMIDINFTATVSSTLKAIDMMSAQYNAHGGTVLNVSSLLALSQHTELHVYAATKTAVLQFSNSIGAEENYSKTRVKVLTACLGPTDTAILQRQNLEDFDKDCTGLTSRVPVRQSVNSAVMGIIDVIKHGVSGSTWIVANDKPAEDISIAIKNGFDITNEAANELYNKSTKF